MKSAPAYLQKNFDDIMQQITALRNENAELKVRMQYQGLSGSNQLESHLSLNSINTVDPYLKKSNSKRSLGSNRSKSTARSRSSLKSQVQYDYNGHRIKSSIKKKRFGSANSSRSGVSGLSRKTKTSLKSVASRKKTPRSKSRQSSAASHNRQPLFGSKNGTVRNSTV